MTREETRRIQHVTGEELLVLAVLGSAATVDAIDDELDRRARVERPEHPRRRPGRRIRRPAA